jgi:hypothetical protein
LGFRERIAGWLAPNLLNGDQVKALVSEEVKLARQALPISLEYDPKGEGYRRIGGDLEVRRDLTPLSQDLMIELAYYLYDTGGLIKRLVRDTKNFCLGEGVSFAVTNDDAKGSAKALLDKFWKVNHLNLRLEKRIEFLCLLGEQCWPVQVLPNGLVLTSYIDPANIDDILTIPDWPEVPAAVKLKGSSGRTGPTLSVIREEGDSRRREYGRLVGQCFFWSINNPPNSHRGRSDLIQIFDFVNSLEENLFDEGDRVRLIKSFIWDVTLKGATDEEIKEFLKNNKTPKPGTTRAHNEQVEWQAIAPDLKMQDSKVYFDTMKTYIAACQNRPDSWFGSGGKAYQTEADLMGEPTFKDLGSRQRLVKEIIEQMLQFQLDQAIIAGTLREEASNPFDIQVDMPEMVSKDLKPVVDSLFTLAQGLALAQTSGWIMDDTATRIFVSMAQRVGVDIDAAEEIKKTAEAKLADPNVTRDYAARQALIDDIVARIQRK